MSILKDLFKAIKGGVSEVGESVVDANLVRILEQDIRDDSNAINKAKQSLTQLKGTEIGLKRKIDSLATDIADYEAKTVEALEAGKEELAIQVAEKIADLESEKDGEDDETIDNDDKNEENDKYRLNKNKICKV